MSHNDINGMQQPMAKLKDEIAGFNGLFFSVTCPVLMRQGAAVVTQVTFALLPFCCNSITMKRLYLSIGG